MPATLFLWTGLLDDRRAPIGGGHPLYRLAHDLFERRDLMDLDEHAVAFTEAIAWWPFPRGAPSVGGHQSRALARLAAAGVPPGERAEILGLAPDSVRHRADRTTRRDRPSPERGQDEGWADEDLQGFALRFQIGTLELDRPPLPRVYRDGEPEPERTFFNPGIVLHQHGDSRWPRRQDAASFLHRANRELVSRRAR